MVIPDLSNAELITLVADNGGCIEAQNWLKRTGYGSREALDNCHFDEWIVWLIRRMVNRDGWLTLPQIVAIGCAICSESIRLLPMELQPAAQADLRACYDFAYGHAPTISRSLHAGHGGLSYGTPAWWACQALILLSYGVECPSDAVEAWWAAACALGDGHADTIARLKREIEAL